MIKFTAGMIILITLIFISSCTIIPKQVFQSLVTDEDAESALECAIDVIDMPYV
ncbi:MAG: hypothetical protein PQJ61_15885 [Spirochaetales bacterium]|uniref:Uncharacterized protein n=1 Tax=Candidatus Thalassospirochaeta sargassi TaxID=3119039 RepID=A0AAJ1MKX4_9SPIO|nr:hypothetical protein [Spirochaetales bacterium]